MILKKEDDEKTILKKITKEMDEKTIEKTNKNIGDAYTIAKQLLEALNDNDEIEYVLQKGIKREET